MAPAVWVSRNFAWIKSPVVPAAKQSNTFKWKLSPQNSVTTETQSTTLNENEDNTVILSFFLFWGDTHYGFELFRDLHLDTALL